MNRRQWLFLISFLLIVSGSALCFANYISPYTITVEEPISIPYTVPVTRREVVFREATLERAENYSVGEYAYSCYNLENGKTITISWQADNNVIVYLMTESQFNVFLSSRVAQNLKSQFGMSGSFSYPIGFDGKYCVVIYNINWFFARVRIIYYQATITWQETATVVDYETRYRTEYVHKQVTTDLYLYLGLIIIVVGEFLAFTAWRGKTSWLLSNT